MHLYQIVEIATGQAIADLLIETRPEILSDTYAVLAVPEAGVDLVTLKAHYEKEINLFAGQVRTRYISPGEGQGITYLRKETEAKVFVALNPGEQNQVTEAEYPWIFKEAAKTGDTPLGVANMIVASAAYWVGPGSDIESTRKRGTKQVSEAVDAAAAKAAFDFAISSLDVYRPE